ncbi:MAG: class I SAM-dependent methyltransferase, partial [Acidimicrobiales bacterium]|nr:class I SAM-dependent methyltransferase [Acidimicrobiales bacterium]
MKDRILRWLRGSHNSVRFRFFGLPKLWLTYLLLYKAKGRSWVDFYGERLDGFVDIEKPLPDSYAARGQDYFAYIHKHGLQPHHRFLDYGCGFLRTALPVIRHLTEGRYVGVDISSQRIARGRNYLRSHGIADDAYDVHVVHDCKLRELDGQRFDFGWAMSVINHMPEEDIKVMLAALRSLMAPGGRFLFVFNESDHTIRWRMKDWWYRRDDMRG